MFEISVKRVHAPWGNKTFETSKKRLKSSRGMFKYDSMTVSSAWELISVSMRYSQGGGVNTSLSRLMYCAHVVCSLVVPFLCVVWLSSVVRSCATRDASNKDNVCKPTIPTGINRPPPSETISYVTIVPNQQKLSLKAKERR